MGPDVCSHWLAQQKIWLSCKTYVLKAGIIKSKYIFQVWKHASLEEPKGRGEKISFFFFAPVITFKVRAEIHLWTLVMLTYPDGSQSPVAKIRWLQPGDTPSAGSCDVALFSKHAPIPEDWPGRIGLRAKNLLIWQSLWYQEHLERPQLRTGSWLDGMIVLLQMISNRHVAAMGDGNNSGANQGSPDLEEGRSKVRFSSMFSQFL